MSFASFGSGVQQRGASIVYATHIFDGLETWATHIAYVEDGKLKRAQPISEVPELSKSKTLIRVVEPWLRTEREQREQKVATQIKTPEPIKVHRPDAVSPWTSSRHMAYYR